MAASGPQLIGAVIEHLQRQDIEMMLSNRGLPAVGSKEELTVRLQHALTEEICEVLQLTAQFKPAMLSLAYLPVSAHSLFSCQA